MKRIKNSFLVVFFLMLFICSPNCVYAAQPPYNVILIICDQETYKLLPAHNYQLQARQTLAQHGITFTNHYTAAAMCSPSRATLLTGVPPQKNGVFDQMEYSYVPTLSTTMPNMGSVLKQLGYRTAYFGKFEMDKTLLANKVDVNYSTLAKPYGFDVFNYNGDVGGTPLQGYSVDSFFVGEAIQWLRAQAVQKQDKPFFMVVSLLNPHDIMYGDANLSTKEPVQTSPVNVIKAPPVNRIYEKNWKFDLPISLTESLKSKGMPNALTEYQQGWAGALGRIPTDRKDMWAYYYNYYLNALRDNDASLQQFINTINEMDLWKNTIIIFTADHGEMGGAHGGLRGKGPMAYEENAHIPLIIAHPQAIGGSKNMALTSHIDMLPTLVGLTGLAPDRYTALLKQFPGHDFSKLMTDSTNTIHAIRPGVLFNYVGISTIDGKYLLNTLLSSFTHKTLPSLTQVDMHKRGFLYFVFDGRYKFVRYYAPDAFNLPTTFEDIFRNNDIQLFDLQTDPNETVNLAIDVQKNKSLILRMNELLNQLIANEVGPVDGKFLPDIIQAKVKTL